MIKAILLMGPTATGKTNLALKLAEDFPIEIISVDSALIYTGLDIGTAKPTAAEQSKVKHHLIDIITPVESYSVAQFIDQSVELIHAINQRGKIPVLVGGTMMYYNGLINGISKLPESNPEIRLQIEIKAANSSWQDMHLLLSEIDPIAAEKIKPNDKQRISRALEVYYQTKKPISILQSESLIKKSSGIDFLPLAIVPNDRAILHKRIAERFNQMLDNGFIEEVKNLQRSFPTLSSNSSSMRSVGYSQVWQYLDGNIDKAELINTGVAATRQLAKRQITWLRSMEVINLDINNLNFDDLYANLVKAVKIFVD